MEIKTNNEEEAFDLRVEENLLISDAKFSHGSIGLCLPDCLTWLCHPRRDLNVSSKSVDVTNAKIL